MKVTAIVVNFNCGAYINNCLNSLMAQDVGNHQFEVVVVDNDSTDKSQSAIEKSFPKLKFIQNPTNMGYSGGNNVGLRYALDTGSDYAWIVNPDFTVARDCLLKFIDGASHHTRDGIFGGKIYFAPGYETHKERYQKEDQGKIIWYAGGLIDWGNLIATHRGVNEVDTEQYNYDGETDFITGACMFIKRRVLEDVGLLDARYFLYYEENDFCQRAKRKGYKLIYLCKPTAWHANAQATGLGSNLQDYYIARNRLLFGLRYAPFWTQQALIREAYRIYKTGRPWQRKGIIDFFTGKLGAGSYQPS